MVGTDPATAPDRRGARRSRAACAALPFGAAVKSQLPAAPRTGTARQVECRLLGPDGPVGATLTADVITRQDGARLLVVTAAGPAQELRGAGKALPRGARGNGPSPRGVRGDGSPREEGEKREASGGGRPARDDIIRAMTRRIDMVTAGSRPLLGNTTFA